jgi:hypothetical protein
VKAATPCAFSLVKRAVLALSCIALIGCGGSWRGSWPPVAKTSVDLAAVPSATRALRARGLSDDDMPDLERFHELVDLDFFGGWGVVENRLTDAGVAKLAALDLPHLEWLYLGSNLLPTDRAIADLLQMKSLRNLGLPECPGISPKGVELLSKMEWLESLDLRANPGLEDQCLLKLGALKNLKHLSLDASPNITPQAVERLKEMLPGCKVWNDEGNWRMMLGGRSSMNLAPSR